MRIINVRKSCSANGEHGTRSTPSPSDECWTMTYEADAYPAAWTHRMPMSRPIECERAAPMDPPTKRAIDMRYTICRVTNHDHSTLA